MNLNDSFPSTEGFESFSTTQSIDGLTAQISGIQTILSYKDSSGTPIPAGSAGSAANVQKASGTTDMTNAGTFPTEGTKGISINSTNRFEILLNQPIAAFSFWGTDLGDNNNSLALALYNGNTLLRESPINYLGANSGNSSVFFFGGIAEAPAEYFNRVVFNNTKTNDAIGLDQFTIAVAEQLLTQPNPSSASSAGVTDPNAPGEGPASVPTPALLPGLLGLMVRLRLRRRAIAQGWRTNAVRPYARMTVMALPVGVWANSVVVRSPNGPSPSR